MSNPMKLKPFDLKAFLKLIPLAYTGMAFGIIFALSMIAMMYVQAVTGDFYFVTVIAWIPLLTMGYWIVRGANTFAIKHPNPPFDIEWMLSIFVGLVVFFVLIYQLGLFPPNFGVFFMTILAIHLAIMGWVFFFMIPTALFALSFMKAAPRFKLEQVHLDVLIASDPVFSSLKLGDKAIVRGIVHSNQKAVLSFYEFGGSALGEINVEMIPQPTLVKVWKVYAQPSKLEQAA